MTVMLKELQPEDRDIFTEMAIDFFNNADDVESKSKEHFYQVFDDIISGKYSIQGFLICDSEQNKQIVGFTTLCFFYSTENGKEVVWLEDLYIKPELRGCHWGSSVLDFITNLYPDACLRLETWQSNEGAIKLYERYGYKKCILVNFVKD